MNDDKTVSLGTFSDGLNSAKQRTTEVAAAALSAVQELDAEKLDKAIKLSAEVSVSSWINGSGNYPFYSDIPIPGITTNDRADIIISPGSIKAAQQAGICPLSETLGDGIRIRAEEKPSTVITAEIWIFKGV